VEATLSDLELSLFKLQHTAKQLDQVPTSEVYAVVDNLFQNLRALIDQQACKELITEQGLMLNICLIFSKTANFSSAFLWTKVEVAVLCRCFDLLSYLDESALL
jgi:hypothetical protein